MNKRTLDTAVPIVYVLLILGSVIFWDSGVLWVAIVGAVIVGGYYAFLRNVLFRPSGG